MLQMGAFVCWTLAVQVATSLQFYTVAAHNESENGKQVRQHDVASVAPHSWSSHTANVVHVQPNATPSFQAGVIRATQLSFSEAPDRYPFILEQILNATHAAATSPLP